jgi:hypothetical protein
MYQIFSHKRYIYMEQLPHHMQSILQKSFPIRIQLLIEMMGNGRRMIYIVYRSYCIHLGTMNNQMYCHDKGADFGSRSH